MSLSSKKSECGYNRGVQKLAKNQAIDDEFASPYPDDYIPDPCNCEDCNPSLSTIYRNRIILMLLKLRAISSEMAHNYWDYFDR